MTPLTPLMIPTPLRINAPTVIGEVLDGEAIIVNLDSGAYYSLTGAGAHLWTALEAGPTTAGLIDWAARSFAGPAAEIVAGVNALLQDMLNEGLVVADSGRATRLPAPGTPVAAVAPSVDAIGAGAISEPIPFVMPVLQKYTDMADLLLLDPIHEVAEQGWPHRAASPKDLGAA